MHTSVNVLAEWNYGPVSYVFSLVNHGNQFRIWIILVIPKIMKL